MKTHRLYLYQSENPHHFQVIDTEVGGVDTRNGSVGEEGCVCVCERPPSEKTSHKNIT